jgi:hypothetical protein
MTMKPVSDDPAEILAALRRLPSSAEVRKLIRTLEDWMQKKQVVQRPGVAGFSLQKTKAMIDFNNWRTQTADGIAWDQERMNNIGYRHPGDPENFWEERFVYKGYREIMKG